MNKSSTICKSFFPRKDNDRPPTIVIKIIVKIIKYKPKFSGTALVLIPELAILLSTLVKILWLTIKFHVASKLAT